MPAPIATLALVTLGSGLVLGGYSYKRAKDAQKKDPLPKLTDAIADGKDKAPAATETRKASQNKGSKAAA